MTFLILKALNFVDSCNEACYFLDLPTEGSTVLVNGRSTNFAIYR